MLLEVEPTGVGDGLRMIGLVKRIKGLERFKHGEPIGLVFEAAVGGFSGYSQVGSLAALLAQRRILLQPFKPRMAELNFAEAQLDIDALVIPVGWQPDIVQPFTGGQPGIVDVFIADAKPVQFDVVVSGALIRDADFQFAPKPSFHEHIQVAGTAEHRGAVILAAADAGQRDEGQNRDDLVPLLVQLPSGDMHFRERQLDERPVFILDFQHHAMPRLAVPVPDMQVAGFAHPGRDGFRVVLGGQSFQRLVSIPFIKGQPLGRGVILANHLDDEFIDFTAGAPAQIASVVGHLRTPVRWIFSAGGVAGR